VSATARNERRRQQRSDRGQRRHDAQRDQPEQHGVRDSGADAERVCALGVEALREPAPSEQRGGDEHEGARGSGEDEVATADQEQAPEQERLDVGPGVEDVAREDHSEREGADQHERGEAVVAAAASTREPLDAECEHEGSGEGAQRRRERKAVGEDEAREGGGRNGVRVEGETAQDDPGADEPGPDREEEHLPEPALDEGLVERGAHGWE
jgi:hypothetical protein